jgi:hypothetical protein
MPAKLKNTFPKIDGRFIYNGRPCYFLTNSCSVDVAKIQSLSTEFDQVKEKVNLLRQVVNGVKIVVSPSNY